MGADARMGSPEWSWAEGGWERVVGLLEEALAERGYDVAAQTGRRQALAGRRDRGAVTLVVAVDAGGRVRVTFSRRLAERSLPGHQPGFPVRRIAETIRVITTTGQARSVDEALAIIDEGARDSPPAPGEGQAASG